MGARLFGRCDVPDLALLPLRYPGVRTASFHAGFASFTGTRLVEWLARKVRDGTPEERAAFRRPVLLGGAAHAAAGQRHAAPCSSRLEGLHHERRAASAHLDAAGAREPRARTFPAPPAIALANKIAGGLTRCPPGAMACMGLLTLDEILEPLKACASARSRPEGRAVRRV